MKNKIVAVQKALDELGIYAGAEPVLGKVAVSLDWQDWKVHCALSNALTDLFGYEGWSYSLTATDGSDCYSAVYTI